MQENNCWAQVGEDWCCNKRVKDQEYCEDHLFLFGIKVEEEVEEDYKTIKT